MSRRSWIVVVAVAAAVCVAAALLVWRPWDAAPPIQTEALGVWQEQTAVDPVRMTVSAADPAADGTPRYWVDLPRLARPSPPGAPRGRRIVVSGEGTGDVIWRITYDEGADVLLLTTPDGGGRHILRRVSASTPLRPAAGGARRAGPASSALARGGRAPLSPRRRV